MGIKEKVIKIVFLGINFLVNLSNVKKVGHINRRKTKHCLPNTCYVHFHFYINIQHRKFHENLHTPHEDCFALFFPRLGAKRI
jgi:hypothetical protein